MEVVGLLLVVIMIQIFGLIFQGYLAIKNKESLDKVSKALITNQEFIHDKLMRETGKIYHKALKHDN